MRLRVVVALLAVVGGLLAAAGCKDKTQEISRPEYLLAHQHRFWKMARETLHSDQPDLYVLVTIEEFLGYRTPRRVKKAYDGADKTEVLARLDALWTAFDAEVLSRLDRSLGLVRLKQGVTMDELRKAFDRVDSEYRTFEAMAPGGS